MQLRKNEFIAFHWFSIDLVKIRCNFYITDTHFNQILIISMSFKHVFFLKRKESESTHLEFSLLSWRDHLEQNFLIKFIKCLEVTVDSKGQNFAPGVRVHTSGSVELWQRWQLLWDSIWTYIQVWRIWRNSPLGWKNVALNSPNQQKKWFSTKMVLWWKCVLQYSKNILGTLVGMFRLFNVS